MEESFSPDGDGGMVSGSFKHISFIVHFISVMIMSAPPPDHQAFVPEGWEPLL